MIDPLDEHYGYLADRVKTARYQAVIDELVRPEHVVLDLGCGSGMLGLMALRAGAAKVFFVEEHSIIEVARRTVIEAGFGDRAEFFQDNSFELTLPERADIILCDHVGYFGFDYGILALLADARQRFLAPDGVIVPAQVHIQLALAESEDCRGRVQRWRDGSVPADFSWVGTPAANAKLAANLNADNLLSTSAEVGTLKLGNDADEFLTWQAELTATRDGTFDGVVGWFNCQLHGDIHMTNSPIAEDSLKRPQAFLPLEEPVAVKAGERVNVTVMLRHLDHVIAWVVELPDSGQHFSLTTFNGLLLDELALNRSRPDRVAQLNSHGFARQTILSYCDGRRTLAEVEALVLQEHPDLFPSAKATGAFVRQVLAKDTSE